MKLSINLVATGKEYIANCPELDVNCYGVSRDEAVRRIKNVLQFYIDSAHEFGLEVERFDAISIEGDSSPLCIASELQAVSRSIN